MVAGTRRTHEHELRLAFHRQVAVAQAEGDLRQGRDVVIEVLCDDESAGENGGPGAPRGN